LKFEISNQHIWFAFWRRSNTTVKNVLISTDGACIGNPGPGGWACILRHGKRSREIYGSEPHTTNNRMELRAAIEGLRQLREPCEVTVYTDSDYLKSGITEWLPKWKLNGWRKSKGSSGSRTVLNQDLWKELDMLAQRHQVQWEWVRGHAKHEDNIRCDFLANKAAREQIASGASTDETPGANKSEWRVSAR